MISDVEHLFMCLLITCVSLKVKVAQSCLTVWDPMDWGLPGSSVHGIIQARILEWVCVPFSRESPQPREWTQASLTAGKFFTSWTTRIAIKFSAHFLPVCFLFFVFFNGCVVGVLCISWILTSYSDTGLDILCYSVGYLFILLIGSFDAWKFLDIVRFIYFSFCCLCILCHSQEVTCQIQCLKCFSQRALQFHSYV